MTERLYAVAVVSLLLDRELLGVSMGNIACQIHWLTATTAEEAEEGGLKIWNEQQQDSEVRKSLRLIYARPVPDGWGPSPDEQMGVSPEPIAKVPKPKK